MPVVSFMLEAAVLSWMVQLQRNVEETNYNEASAFSHKETPPPPVNQHYI